MIVQAAGRIFISLYPTKLVQQPSWIALISFENDENSGEKIILQMNVLLQQPWYVVLHNNHALTATTVIEPNKNDVGYFVPRLFYESVKII